MLLGAYRFDMIFDSDAVLPGQPGLAFRGTFARALRQVVCAFPGEDCGGCQFRRRCLYPFTFPPEPPASRWPDNLSRFPAAGSGPAAPRRGPSWKRPAGAGGCPEEAPPYPFVVEPVTDAPPRLRRGDPFSFRLLLLGKANESLPYFLYAVARMGKVGIGRPVEGVRGRFSLRRVVATDPSGPGEIPVFDGARGQIREGNFTEDMTKPLETPPLWRGGPPPPHTLAVTLLTPLFLTAGRPAEPDLPFRELVREALHRISSLCRAYGRRTPDLDRAEYLSRARDVQTLDNGIVPWSGEPPRRRALEIPDVGLSGRAVYRGDLAFFLPLLRCCEKVHLGGRTAYGEGRIRLENGGDAAAS